MNNILKTGLVMAVLAGIALPGWARMSLPPGTNADRRTMLKTTAGQCNPANATIDLDINNVRARLMTGGDMWYDRGTTSARYEIPKGSGKSSLFAGSIWVGGIDEQKALKVAAQLYRSPGNDYYPGPTKVDNFGVNSAPDKTTCSDWDKFWKIDRSTLIAFREDYRSNKNAYLLPQYQTIKEWPATGNQNAVGTSGLALSELTNPDYRNNGRNFAPFVDINSNGLYEPENGDYPDILGDQYIWWVFNDMGNAKLMSGTNAIGMEVQTSSFAFSSKDYLNDASFVFYKLINRGTLTLQNTYMATWTDADLGFAADDYVGCDTARSLGILYNGTGVDGNGGPGQYGSQVPMVGVDFFIGPKKRTYTDTGKYENPRGRYNEDTLGMTVFNYFNIGTTGPNSDPTTGSDFYYIMRGFNKAGEPLRDDMASGPASTGHGPGKEVSSVYYGEPNVPNTWSECQCGTPSGDRRFVHSSGPFELESGGITNDIIIGVCWVPNVGGCPNTNFSRIRAADDLIQDLFDNKFKTIDGPEAPRLVVREMDRKLIFYLVNDSNSTNFQERFGYDTAAKYRVSTPKTRRYTDSLYKFEGYRVFQLKNKSVTVSNIFNDKGELNTDVAAEVFQTDIKNGIAGNIVNYTGNPDKAAGVYDAAIKVTNKDSGLIHSFQLTNDAFGKGEDKRFVNYRTYYFVAIAYAYNNFRQFTYEKADSSQQTPYLESSKAAGGRNIPVVEAMPNPANGDMGTVINSDYGTGVIIKRMEGIGNGGNATSFDAATETTAMTGPNYQATQPVYTADGSPVSVKVIDPRLIPETDWELYITGVPFDGGDSTRGIAPATGSWMLVNSNGDIIHSERNLEQANEQIAQKYGLSINITQVLRPGDKGAPNNGYITSTITYNDPSRAWLAGVRDGEGTSPLNWIRSGELDDKPSVVICDYDDKNTQNNPDSNQVYEKLLFNSTPNVGTWAPVTLAAVEDRGDCGFGVANNAMARNELITLPGVDIVFTSDKTKWTKCVVLELQDEASLAEGNAFKFTARSHRSWTGNVNSNGSPEYAQNKNDTGFSYFPGYAINQETGERVNIVFGEDSYLKIHNGNDMIWNPSNTILDPNTGNVIFGGKHYIYILNTKYDEGKSVVEGLNKLPQDYSAFQWVGVPTLYGNQHLLPLSEGLIPTETRIRIRVNKPYGRYIADASQALKNKGYPLYQFSTRALAPQALADADNKWNSDKKALLDQIFVSPNPYYGYVGYENNRLDTRVRIVNLPRLATIHIYSLDGTLIRTLTKDNPNESFVDWDTRNAKGLTIASGMYLIHVKAEGIGETVIRWFGAFRPVDITTY